MLHCAATSTDLDAVHVRDQLIDPGPAVDRIGNQVLRPPNPAPREQVAAERRDHRIDVIATARARRCGRTRGRSARPGSRRPGSQASRTISCAWLRSKHWLTQPPADRRRRQAPGTPGRRGSRRGGGCRGAGGGRGRRSRCGSRAGAVNMNWLVGRVPGRAGVVDPELRIEEPCLAVVDGPVAGVPPDVLDLVGLDVPRVALDDVVDCPPAADAEGRRGGETANGEHAPRGRRARSRAELLLRRLRLGGRVAPRGRRRRTRPAARPRRRDAELLLLRRRGRGDRRRRAWPPARAPARSAAGAGSERDLAATALRRSPAAAAADSLPTCDGSVSMVDRVGRGSFLERSCAGRSCAGPRVTADAEPERAPRRPPRTPWRRPRRRHTRARACPPPRGRPAWRAPRRRRLRRPRRPPPSPTCAVASSAPLRRRARPGRSARSPSSTSRSPMREMAVEAVDRAERRHGAAEVVQVAARGGRRSPRTAAVGEVGSRLARLVLAPRPRRRTPSAPARDRRTSRRSRPRASSRVSSSTPRVTSLR